MVGKFYFKFQVCSQNPCKDMSHTLVKYTLTQRDPKLHSPIRPKNIIENVFQP